MAGNNQIERITIERMSYGQDAIGIRENGQIIFVAGACPGDVIEARIVQEKPSFARGVIEQILEPSHLRSTFANAPQKDYLGRPDAYEIPGLDWRHISTEAQASLKEANLRHNLERIARRSASEIDAVLQPIKTGSKIWHYRNKVELINDADQHPDHPLTLGMKRLDAHKQATDPHEAFYPVSNLALLPKKSMGSPRALQGALRFLEKSGSLNITRAGIRHAHNTKSLEVALWTRPGPCNRKMVGKTIQDAVPGCTSVTRVLVRPEVARASRQIRGVEALAGKGYWQEKLDGIDFKISSPSFFQVNSEMAQVLIDEVKACLSQVYGDALHWRQTPRLFDLYCGAGTFALPLAKAGYQVTGIELAGSSIQDLRRNAEVNAIDLEIFFDCLTSTSFLRQLRSLSSKGSSGEFGSSV